MADLNADLKELLSRTELVVFPEDYVAVDLPVGTHPIPGEWFRPATTRFALIVQEPKSVTMVVPRRKWLRMKGMLEKYDVKGLVKIIGFDKKLSLVTTGYMCAVGTVLSDNGIRAVPTSTFKSDQIIVPKEELPRAVRVLREFLAACRKKPARTPVKKGAARPAGKKSPVPAARKKG
ncbi:MAG: ACT domain-containing protein [Acidobacteria bacterium]|nr:ACT domain-containing protein [Acidobacteriota bacterium]